VLRQLPSGLRAAYDAHPGAQAVRVRLPAHGPVEGRLEGADRHPIAPDHQGRGELCQGAPSGERVHHGHPGGLEFCRGAMGSKVL